MRWIFVIGIVFAAGLAAGVFFSPDDPPAESVPTLMGPPPKAPPTDRELADAGEFVRLARQHTASFGGFEVAIEHLGVGGQLSAIDAWQEVHGPSFPSLIMRTRLLTAQSDWDGAVDALIDAAMEVERPAQQSVLDTLLETTTASASKALTAESRTDDLDVLLEKITLALPEQARYFLRLGALRTRTGDEAGALAVLSQIQQHPEYGEEARMLLADTGAARESDSRRRGTLPLRQRGDQFVIEATLDGRGRVSLLIDTGASMTVVSERVMSSLGYPLDGPRAWFSTAGGTVEAPVLTVGSLSLGDATVRQLAVGVLPVDFPDGIDGLLGMNFLRHFEFRIDQNAALLELERGGPQSR